MKVEIFSLKQLSELLLVGFPQKTAVISFTSPRKTKGARETLIKLCSVCENVISITLPDLDIGVLEEYGYSPESYLSEADELASFIYDASSRGDDIICQCDYGQSRSAACAAAILEHFEHSGISIFRDYRYYPNQLVFNKVYSALENHKK